MTAPRDSSLSSIADRSTPGGGYDVVERLHLRQWAMRIVVPLALLATNGAGRFEIEGLPRHDLPDLPASVEVGLRIVGGALVLVAAAVRVRAKGVLVRKTTLTTGGIYGVVRHPFYLANLVGAVGTFLLAGSLGAVVAAVWLVLATPLYAVTIAGEERALARIYPEEFAAYAARVRALIPGRPPSGTPSARTTWANLMSEREPPRLLRFVAGALFVLGAATTGPWSNALLAAGALAMGASYSLR